jgi:hypothetical protein
MGTSISEYNLMLTDVVNQETLTANLKVIYPESTIHVATTVCMLPYWPRCLCECDIYICRRAMESHNLSHILPSKECLTFAGRIRFMSYVTICRKLFDVKRQK